MIDLLVGPENEFARSKKFSSLPHCEFTTIYVVSYLKFPVSAQPLYHFRRHFVLAFTILLIEKYPIKPNLPAPEKGFPKAIARGTNFKYYQF